MECECTCTCTCTGEEASLVAAFRDSGFWASTNVNIEMPYGFLTNLNRIVDRRICHTV